VKSELEDEDVRMYTRMDRVLEMGDDQTWKWWLDWVDVMVNNRMRMG
jgi:hypothetical protein